MFKNKYLHFFAVLAFSVAGAVHAQGWKPQRNVEIIHGSAPGGSNDKRAR